MSLASAHPVTFVLSTDPEKLVPFYRDTLGLPVASVDAFATVFDLGGIRLRLTRVEGHQPSAHTVLGWNVADMAGTMKALKDRGVTFLIYPGFGQSEDGVWTSPDGMAKIAWFSDPEGNNLSITGS